MALQNVKKILEEIGVQNERQINIKYRVHEGNMWIQSRLIDDYHNIVLYWQIDMTTHTVTAIEGEMDNHPFDDCTGALQILEQIKGLEIGVGVKRNFRARFPKADGCTHITELSLATFDFVISRLYGAANADLSVEQKSKRFKAIATFLCNNDSCKVFNKENAVKFDSCGRYKGKMYEY
jgi:hypothetical protein